MLMRPVQFTCNLSDFFHCSLRGNPALTITYIRCSSLSGLIVRQRREASIWNPRVAWLLRDVHTRDVRLRGSRRRLTRQAINATTRQSLWRRSLSFWIGDGVSYIDLRRALVNSRNRYACFRYFDCCLGDTGTTISID